MLVATRSSTVWGVFAIIIMLLGVMAFVGSGGSREKVKAAQIRSDLEQIAVAQDKYYDDYNEYASSYDNLLQNYLNGDLRSPYTNQPYLFDSEGDAWLISVRLESEINQICSNDTSKKDYWECSAQGGEDYNCLDITK